MEYYSLSSIVKAGEIYKSASVIGERIIKPVKIACQVQLFGKASDFRIYIIQLYALWYDFCFKFCKIS